jgi:hypothetical protein
MEIKASEEWLKKSGDGTLCRECKDAIFGNRYIYCFEVFDKVLETKIQLCESCYEIQIRPARG